MKQALKLAALALIVIAAPRPVPAQELGERVFFDAFLEPLEKWETAPGVTVLRDKNALVFKTDTSDSGWLTFGQRLPFFETATLSLGLMRTVHGKFSVQIEWFREDGMSFLASSDVLESSSDTPQNKTIKLAEYLPKLPNDEKPSRFRLKFWLTGQNAVAEVSQAIIHVQRSWRDPSMQLMRAYSPDDAVVEDEGIDYRTDRGAFAAVLTKAETASIIFWDRVNLSATGMILFDLESVQSGKVTLHALCWNDQNQFLKEVEITPEISSGGLYEIPIKDHQADFPPETARLSFKVWLTGKDASIRLAGIYYGVSQ